MKLLIRAFSILSVPGLWEMSIKIFHTPSAGMIDIRLDVHGSPSARIVRWELTPPQKEGYLNNIPPARISRKPHQWNNCLIIIKSLFGKRMLYEDLPQLYIQGSSLLAPLQSYDHIKHVCPMRQHA